MKTPTPARADQPPRKRTTIEISKEYLHFAAAHFTIFGPGQRENLHGHNFYVTLEADTEVDDAGLAFDYNVLKDVLKSLCDELDEKTLLPALSPHLRLESDDQYVYALFGSERLPFLPRDVICMELRNITVEELAHYFLERLLEHDRVAPLTLFELDVRVSSGPGQWARATWQCPPESPR